MQQSLQQLPTLFGVSLASICDDSTPGQQGLDISGTYVDAWKGSEPIVVLQAKGQGFVVEDPTGKWPSEDATLNGDRIEFWRLKGQVQQKDGGCEIHWANGAVYKRVQDNMQRQAWQAPSPAATTPQEDASGNYIDAWTKKAIAVLSFNGTGVHVDDPNGKWPSEDGTLNGDRINFWGLDGSLNRNGSGYEIVWDNKSTWTRVESSASTQAAPNPWDVTADLDARNWNEQSDSTTNSQSWATPDNRSATQATGDSWNKEARPEPGPPPRSQDEANSSGDPKLMARWREYQEYQTWYIQSGIVPGKTKEEHEADEQGIFQQGYQAGEGIDFNLYDRVPCQVTGPQSENCKDFPTTFEELFQRLGNFIPTELGKNIRRCQYNKPTPVQRFAIPVALLGRDVMCCAQTGSGKTAAFLIPVLASMIKHVGNGVGSMKIPFKGPCLPDAIVMAPTRELCLQIYGEALKFLHMSTFRPVRVYGQEANKKQIEQIAKGADLVVATPGRLWDFVSSGIISVENVNTLVMDEADRMLEMEQYGFFRDVVEKFGMPSKEYRQTMMFSATFPQTIQKLATDYLYEHLFISVGTIGTPAITVTQKFVKVGKDDKVDRLLEILHHWLDHRDKEERMLIFVNSKNMAKFLNEQLWDKSIDIGALHGDLDQAAREDNLQKLRDGRLDVMVATDVASRGLDIRMVRHVINYDLPRNIGDYVHRIGRTGRIGHRGNATTFVTVDKDTGEFTDSPEVLQQIPDLLQDCPEVKAALPDWLLTKVEQLKKRQVECR